MVAVVAGSAIEHQYLLLVVVSQLVSLAQSAHQQVLLLARVVYAQVNIAHHGIDVAQSTTLL